MAAEIILVPVAPAVEVKANASTTMKPWRRRMRFMVSIAQAHVDVGAVDSRVASGGPAGAHLHQCRMRYLADDEFSRRHPGPLDLCMAAQAQVVVGLLEHHAVDR